IEARRSISVSIQKAFLSSKHWMVGAFWKFIGDKWTPNLLETTYVQAIWYRDHCPGFLDWNYSLPHHPPMNSFLIQVGDLEFDCHFATVLGKKTLVANTGNVEAAVL